MVSDERRAEFAGNDWKESQCFVRRNFSLADLSFKKKSFREFHDGKHEERP